jgi:transcriptional regulator with XRE-family HTH domain
VIELRVSLAKKLRARRRAQKISQETFATRIGSSQSRVAKMEAGDPSVSIDLLIRSLINAGSTKEEIGEVIANASAE